MQAKSAADFGDGRAHDGTIAMYGGNRSPPAATIISGVILS
jgi:hypothetical protein